MTLCPAITSFRFATPLGWMELAANEEHLTAIRFVEDEPPHPNPAGSVFFDLAASQISEYLKGQRRLLDLPHACPGTPFQREVWSALTEIPYGQTLSYRSLARQLGRGGSERAVGRAVGSNPLLLLVPCHRVIGADGRLCGYAGGLWRKQWLLEMECLDRKPDLFSQPPGPPRR